VPRHDGGLHPEYAARFYVALAAVTEAITRSKHPEELFSSVCHAICERSGLDVAWISIFDAAEQRLRTIPASGRHAETVNGAGNGYYAATGLSDATLSHWIQPADVIAVRDRTSASRECGMLPPPLETIRSSALIPFGAGEWPLCCLHLHTEQPDFFSEPLLPLMRTMGSSLSFALQNYAREKSRHTAQQQLRDSEARYRLLIQHFPDGAVALFDHNMRYQIADGKGLARLGIRPRECLDRSIQDVLTPELYRALEPHYRRALAGRNSDATLNACGRHWEIQISPVRDSGEEIVGGLMVAQDLTEKKRSEQMIRLTSEAFQGIADAVVIMDGQLSILFVNKAYTTITGHASEDVLGTKPQILTAEYHEPSFFANLWAQVQSTGAWQGEVWDTRKGGERYPIFLKISAVKDHEDNVTNYIGAFNDISQAKEYEAQLQHLAHHDALTGLPNRSLLSSRTKVAIAQARRHSGHLALLFLDLDRFKRINDSLGHAIGDKLLKLVAERLQQVVREADTVSRHGGDEFLVLLNEVSEPEAAARVAEKIMRAIAQPYVVDDHELVTGASVGIAIYPDDGRDMGELLRNADAAMYSAKQLGGSRFEYYSAHMNTRAAERLELEQELRYAVEKDQLSLVYQPQIEIASGRIVGIEALLRWRHPTLGAIPPDRFITVAQDAGLILPIGDWVLREACRQRKQWVNLPDSVPISVNVSAIQFRQANFVNRVAAILEETRLLPSALELEVTESVVMHGAQEMIDTLTALNRHGLTLAIDDFGTGYSSLSYLRNLPIHRLKIDRSFVTDLPANKDAAAITKAIVDMGRTLGLDVIAEGVETEAQADFLRNAACLSAQGYLYCHPLVADELERWFARGTRPWTRLRVADVTSEPRASSAADKF
jgi:diguanylate cyclase (GGDEF)-like protein/PAS domain S-box-containing protein